MDLEGIRMGKFQWCATAHASGDGRMCCRLAGHTGEHGNWQHPIVEIPALSGYRVRHNFDRFRPARWAGDWVRDFGPDNRGALVIAHSEEEAIGLAAKALRRDPAFLIAVWDLVTWDDDVIASAVPCS